MLCQLAMPFRRPAAPAACNGGERCHVRLRQPEPKFTHLAATGQLHDWQVLHTAVNDIGTLYCLRRRCSLCKVSHIV